MNVRDLMLKLSKLDLDTIVYFACPEDVEKVYLAEEVNLEEINLEGKLKEVVVIA